MMRTYKLELETLRALLEELGQSGRLSATLPPGLAGIKERCQARIDLQNGKIIFCALVGPDGSVRVSGSSALQALSRLGPHDWNFTETQPDTLVSDYASARPLPQDTRGIPTPSRIPQRVAFPQQSVMNVLSRQQRRILGLIDGARSVEKIAFLLYSSSGIQAVQSVEEVLHELEMMGFIR